MCETYCYLQSCTSTVVQLPVFVHSALSVRTIANTIVNSLHLVSDNTDISKEVETRLDRALRKAG